MVIEKRIFLKTHQLIFSLIESKAFAKGYLVAEIEVFFFFFNDYKRFLPSSFLTTYPFIVIE